MLYDQYGEPGSKIPGSKYLRNYCVGCQAPIRVLSMEPAPACEECMEEVDREESQQDINDILISELQYDGPVPRWDLRL